MDIVDCQPDFCLDLYEQSSGHGRKRRSITSSTNTSTNTLTDYTKFKQNIEYTVIMPSEYDETRVLDSGQCRQFANLSMALAVLLAFSTVIVRNPALGMLTISVDFIFLFADMYVGVQNAVIIKEKHR